MNTLWQDLRHGARMLIKNPGFTLVAVLTLAIGIGANTAIFSVVNAVLLRPLPFPQPDRLVAIGSTSTTDRTRFWPVSYPDFADWRAQQSAFERMAVYYTRGFTLQTDAGAVRVSGAVTSADVFPLLGIAPAIGRAFRPSEDEAGGGRVVLLSHQSWRDRFASEPQIVGKVTSLNGESYTIAGVMPEGYQFPIQSEPVELWANLAKSAESTSGPPETEQRGNYFLSAIGRLRPGSSLEQAEAQIVAISANLEKQYPNKAGVSVRARALNEDLTGDVKRSLLMLFAAVGFVLLIACANVASLLLARAINRRREIAVRVALGAGRWRLIRQLLTESLLLAGVGGAGGALLAAFGTDILVAVSPTNIPRLAEVGLDARVLLFSAGMTTLVGLAMGLAPAWQLSKPDLQHVLKEGGRGAATSGHAGLRSALIVGEIAIAMVLLAGAGLMIQSFARLMRVDPGFNPEQVVTMRIAFPDGMYDQPRQISSLHERLSAALEGLPGVTSLSTVAPLPMSGNNFGVGFNIEGRPNPTGRAHPYNTRLSLVGSDYFRTLGIQFRHGRDFTQRDNMEGPPVVIINESLARQYFPDEDAVGNRINPSIGIGDGELPMREIIGVVADMRSRDLETAPEPEVYLHIPQLPALGAMTLLLRTQSNPQPLVAAVRERVATLDPNLPISDVRTFDHYVARTVAQPRFNSLLLGAFAGVALLLTAIGLYGIIAYSVSQRTAEIGIRMALGAKTSDVLRLIIAKGIKLVLLGVLIGLLGAISLTRLMEGLLFGVSATDPLTLAGVGLLLALVALMACYLPARRATRVDPMAALRCE